MLSLAAFPPLAPGPLLPQHSGMPNLSEPPALSQVLVLRDYPYVAYYLNQFLLGGCTLVEPGEYGVPEPEEESYTPEAMESHVLSYVPHETLEPFLLALAPLLERYSRETLAEWNAVVRRRICDEEQSWWGKYAGPGWQEFDSSEPYEASHHQFMLYVYHVLSARAAPSSQKRLEDLAVSEEIFAALPLRRAEADLGGPSALAAQVAVDLMRLDSGLTS